MNPLPPLRPLTSHVHHPAPNTTKQLDEKNSFTTIYCYYSILLSLYFDAYRYFTLACRLTSNADKSQYMSFTFIYSFAK